MSRARDLFERIRAEGMAAINALIADRAAEELFLDFKRSGGNGAGNVLQASDNKNLSKAISGFGNSAGGIVIWGIDCSPGPNGADVAAALHPLHDAQAFRSRLESSISRLTVPPHDGVENIAIADGNDANGYVVTLVPPCSRAPIRAEAAGLRNYYIRAGSSFEVIPHDALAGMFGRVPRARLALQFVSLPARRPQHQQDQRMVLAFSIAVANVGSVLAEKVFVSMWWGNAERMEFSVNQKTNAYPVRTSDFPGVQAIAMDGISLAPDAVDGVLDCVIKLPDDPSVDLLIRLTIGARNAEPEITWIRATVQQLQQAVARSRNEQFRTDEVLIISSAAND